MKTKKFGFAVPALAAMALLAACVPTDPTTSTSSEGPTPSSSSTTIPSTSSEPSSSSDPGPSIEHRDPFVSAIPEGSIVREYDERYDHMLEDMSGTALQGTSNGTIGSQYLRVLVDTNDANMPKTPAAAIYKKGTAAITLQDGYSIGFRMRLAEGNIALKDLKLGLRGAAADNDASVYPIRLSEAYDENADELPELTNEFQDFVISPGESIADEATVYPGTSAKVLSDIVGFHLMADDANELSGIIEIEKVFAVKNGEETPLDTFNRKEVGALSAEGGYWNNSTGFIYQRGLTVKEGITYETPSSAPLADYDKLVVQIQGDTSGSDLLALYGEDTPVSFDWDSLKADAEKAVPSAVNGAFHNLVIDLPSSGIAKSGLTGFRLTSTTDIRIAKLFLTNMEVPAPITTYPSISSTGLLTLDEFERTATPDAKYDDSVTRWADDPTIRAFVDFANQGKAKMDGHDLVFMPSSEATPANVTVSFKSTETYGHEYLVLPMKVEGGTAGEGLEKLRIKTNNGEGHKWIHEWFAAEGLPTVPTDASSYEYVDADGYTYYIFDLNFMAWNGADVTELGFYYGGDATIKVKAAYLATDESWSLDRAINKVEEGGTYDVSGYVYAGSLGKAKADAAYIELKGDGVVTLDSIRIQQEGGVTSAWGNSGLKIFSLTDGRYIDPSLPVPETAITIVIPFAANGLDPELEADVHLHVGAVGTGSLTKISGGLLKKGTLTPIGDNTKPRVIKSTTSPEVPGYEYGGYYADIPTSLELSVTFTTACSLASFHIVLADAKANEYATFFANASENWNTVYSWADGTPFDGNAVMEAETSKVLVVDLMALETVKAKADSHVHLKAGVWAVTDITINLVNAVYESQGASSFLAALNPVEA